MNISKVHQEEKVENKYILITNLKASTKKVYEKHFEAEKYNILVNEEKMIIAKQTNNNDINLEHEKIIIETLASMAKKYTFSKILYIDLTKDINSILKRIEGEENIRHTDNRITWAIRQAITKAIIKNELKK